MTHTPLSRSEVLELGESLPLEQLMAQAADLRDIERAAVLSFSPKVFIPLTRLCRDVCHYCTFATTPSALPTPYLDPDQVLQLARAGAAAGCKEALFTLGDRPESRYRVAREWLAHHGFRTTIDYVGSVAARVLKETGLLPHINAGVLSEEEYRTLRPVAPSMGLMLEATAERLCLRGGPHFGCPDKAPKVRLQSLRAAGLARVPMTTGLLIGIGETREERIDGLLAIRELHAEGGHIQEVIIQNFVPKPDTPMADAAPADFNELLWTIAVARIVLGVSMRLQVPPNLNPDRLLALIEAGIDDFGGVSPITPDHVNPESPWPEVSRLRAVAHTAGKSLVPRLTIHPEFIQRAEEWLDPGTLRHVLELSDAEGFARVDPWRAGITHEPPTLDPDPPRANRQRPQPLSAALHRAVSGDRLSPSDVVELFSARDGAVDDIVAAADSIRWRSVGDVLTFVVNRNINYTNLCMYRCTFCAFSKGRGATRLRGPAYRLDIDEVVSRAQEAAARGATEVCMQGGIHPDFTGETYLALCKAVKSSLADLHIHAFSPLEVHHGATTLGLSLEHYLEKLRAAGLGSLPGTAAEILDDRVRARICPDKVTTREWLRVIEAAHRVGLKTTATIMFGHLETPVSWAEHLLHIRDLQERTGGFTEFVPLPFVAQEAPMYLRGRARPGPTWREALLMHAVARLVLYPHLRNVQASWVKLGVNGVLQCLAAGVNDVGGTLMNESISRAAGAQHGQELTGTDLRALARRAGRTLRQRTTLYGDVARQQSSVSEHA